MSHYSVDIAKVGDIPGVRSTPLFHFETTDDSLREKISAVAENHSKCCHACPDYYDVVNKNLPVMDAVGLWPFVELAQDATLRVILWEKT